MRKGRGYTVESFGPERRMVAASAATGRGQNTIHLLIEADIGAARRIIEEELARGGSRLSLTAYIVACLARTMDEFPSFNAFRRGGRLVILEELTVSVLVEREIAGRSVPEPVGIRDAGKKTWRQISEEIRAEQARKGQALGAATGTEWISLIPPILLRLFIHLASRSISMQRRFGVVAVSSIGMFGSLPMWALPLTSATVTIAVGSIAKRLALHEGQVVDREALCLTLSFNHDIIDGAPAARFAARFAEHIASMDGVER